MIEAFKMIPDWIALGAVNLVHIVGPVKLVLITLALLFIGAVILVVQDLRSGGKIWH